VGRAVLQEDVLLVLPGQPHVEGRALDGDARHLGEGAEPVVVADDKGRAVGPLRRRLSGQLEQDLRLETAAVRGGQEVGALAVGDGVEDLLERDS
jgi:hypothetical protein